MASPTSAPVTPEVAGASNPTESASPGAASSSSEVMSPDVSAFLTQFRAVGGGSGGADMDKQLCLKRREREAHKVAANTIARELKKSETKKPGLRKKGRVPPPMTCCRH